MRFKAESGDAFELVVLRYEYPDITEDLWDSNWLVVSGKVTSGHQSWQFVEPCVTTFELEELAEWLENIGPHESVELAFTEPNLAFSYSPRPVPVIRIRFAHESAPPLLKEPAERETGITLDFPISNDQARGLAADLRNTLIEYPIRGGAA